MDAGIWPWSMSAGQTVEVAQPAEPGERVRLCVRPEDVTLFPGAPKPGGTREFNRLAGKVQRLVPEWSTCSRDH